MDEKTLAVTTQAIIQETLGGLVLENSRLQAQVRVLTAENQRLQQLSKPHAIDPRDRDSCREN